MSNSESWEPVAYEANGFVIYVPSSWEQIDGDDRTFRFEHQSGLCLAVETLGFEREEDQFPHPSEIDMLKDRDEPEIEWKSNPVMLASGAAMMSYRCGELDDPEWVNFYCELCRYKSHGLLDVIRFGGAVARDALNHPETVYWAHALHDLARMTEFTSNEDDEGLELEPDSNPLGLN
jgi:hypothetical protein